MSKGTSKNKDPQHLDDILCGCTMAERGDTLLERHAATDSHSIDRCCKKSHTDGHLIEVASKQRCA